MAILFTLAFASVPAFAQQSYNATQDGLRLKPNEGEEPIMEQLSDKGIYRVLLRWPDDTLHPTQEAPIEIVFLNSSAPYVPPQNSTVTNSTGEGVITAEFNDTGVVEPTLEVESYDIAMYDADGNELWKKLDQPGVGGRGEQVIELNSSYTGPVTINVTDIRPGWTQNETANDNELVDSVAFAATVVPEFPLVPLLLAAGISGALLVIRLRFGSGRSSI